MQSNLTVLIMLAEARAADQTLPRLSRPVPPARSRRLSLARLMHGRIVRSHKLSRANAR